MLLCCLPFQVKRTVPRPTKSSRTFGLHVLSTGELHSDAIQHTIRGRQVSWRDSFREMSIPFFPFLSTDMILTPRLSLSHAKSPCAIERLTLQTCLSTNKNCSIFDYKLTALRLMCYQGTDLCYVEIVL